MAIIKHIFGALERHFGRDTLRPLYQLGTSKLFLRRGVLAWLEQQRERIQDVMQPGREVLHTPADCGVREQVSTTQSELDEARARVQSLQTALSKALEINQ